MFTGNIYRIMIGCPSDVKDEVMIAKEIIQNWTAINAEATRTVLLPLHWNSDSYPAYGSHPQKLLDKQLVDKSDLLVCIFAAKIGTPTDTAASGSIEEIEEHIKAGKPVMLYFRSRIDVKSTSPEDLQKLLDFKASVQDSGFYWEFTDENMFKELFRNQLQQFLNDNWLKNRPATSGVKQDDNQIVFDDDELHLFSQWANNPTDSNFMARWTRQGLEVHFGYHNGRVFSRGEEEAQYEDFMNRLQRAGYIVPSGRNGNVTYYKITKQGYDFAKTL